MGLGLLWFAFDRKCNIIQALRYLPCSRNNAQGFFSKLASVRDSSEEFTHMLTTDSTLISQFGHGKPPNISLLSLYQTALWQRAAEEEKTGHSDCVKPINLSPQGMP